MYSYPISDYSIDLLFPAGAPRYGLLRFAALRHSLRAVPQTSPFPGMGSSVRDAGSSGRICSKFEDIKWIQYMISRLNWKSVKDFRPELPERGMLWFDLQGQELESRRNIVTQLTINAWPFEWISFGRIRI